MSLFRVTTKRRQRAGGHERTEQAAVEALPASESAAAAAETCAASRGGARIRPAGTVPSFVFVHTPSQTPTIVLASGLSLSLVGRRAGSDDRGEGQRLARRYRARRASDGGGTRGGRRASSARDRTWWGVKAKLAPFSFATAFPLGRATAHSVPGRQCRFTCVCASCAGSRGCCCCCCCVVPTEGQGSERERRENRRAVGRSVSRTLRSLEDELDRDRWRRSAT
jgi:hypothetical protein